MPPPVAPDSSVSTAPRTSLEAGYDVEFDAYASADLHDEHLHPDSPIVTSLHDSFLLDRLDNGPDLRAQELVHSVNGHELTNVASLELPSPLAPENDGRGYISDNQLSLSHHDFRAATSSADAALPSVPAPRRRHTNTVMKHALAHGIVAPGQPAPLRRLRGKSAVLHLSMGGEEVAVDDDDEKEVDITAYCFTFELDMDGLANCLRERFGHDHVKAFPEELKAGQSPEILHATYIDDTGSAIGDIICLEFGVVVCWNLTSGQEAEAVWQLAGQHALQRIPESDIEVDELVVQYGHARKPVIRDDTVTMTKRAYDDPLVRVAISLALAQSTRISVQETQVMEMVYSTRTLPMQLVKSGKVSMPHEELAILIGKVFLQKSALNLQVLSPHKETPKFFWGRPDQYQSIYHSVSDYLDLDERAEVLNTRFSALTDMLDLMRDQQCSAHEEHLEWIVIILILITTSLGLLQIASLLGVVHFSEGGTAATMGKLFAFIWTGTSNLVSTLKQG